MVKPGNLIFIDVFEMDRQLIEFMKRPIELHVYDPFEWLTEFTKDMFRDQEEARRRVIQLTVS